MSWIDDSSLGAVDRSTVELTITRLLCSYLQISRFPGGLGSREYLEYWGQEGESIRLNLAVHERQTPARDKHPRESLPITRVK